MTAAKMARKLTDLGYEWSLRDDGGGGFCVDAASQTRSASATGKTPKQALRKALLNAALIEVEERDEMLRQETRRLATATRGIDLTPKHEEEPS